MSNLSKGLTGIFISGVIIWGIYELKRDNLAKASVESSAAQKEVVAVNQKLNFPQDSINNFEEILQRPLFFESRRIPTETTSLSTQKKPSTPAPKQLKQFKLTAIILTQGNFTAIIYDNNLKTSQSYIQDETLLGWKISQINEDSVTLKSAGKEQKLFLRDFNNTDTGSTRPLNKGLIRKTLPLIAPRL